jgi:hypothetical protein
VKYVMACRWTVLLRAGHRLATGHGPCSASNLFETGARFVRAIRGILVLCLAMATHLPELYRPGSTPVSNLRTFSGARLFKITHCGG